MWILSNETPFAAQESWTRDENGHEIWLVAIKASFEIAPDGRQTLLEKQIPVNMAPVFASDPNELLDETDFNLEKKRTDVLIKGHAYAANGGPGTQIGTRIKVADVDKSLTVTGDRVFIPGPVGVAMSQPEPFLKMPITWRRSYGGTDTQASRPGWEQRNPVGTGFAVHPQHLVGKTVPNFEYPEAHDKHRPAGYGPVGRHWLPRIKYAGTYGTEWEQTRDPLLPRDFSRIYYQCAPEDQQTKSPLVGYELVQLGNFTPDGFLQFLLPRITFDIVTRFYRGPDRTHGEPPIHTLRLMPDKRQFSIAWLSALHCPFDGERLKITTVNVRERMGVSQAVIQSGVWTGSAR
ncbi:hypothetical protein MesoLjLc_53660 [Mesorhizobium sp. L-8-10]|uniref:DUF2169 family type VI secretion system accessory protein n=1 Tax=Mesorhizobium sp. L-8-10 TaxID=2744523 RepID=UPI001927C3E1|nr:DUF2169 domain-containing protein [Mesorhizobium sp. L-8-10]BCH33436.1 hypothetical protein MesoLjLc_53660 [Mesorhizobium sp. L-8-10]